MDLIPLVLAGLAFPVGIAYIIIDNSKECKNCGFNKVAHSDKDKQWHPDSEPCKNFT